MGTLADNLRIQSQIPGYMPNLFEVSLFGADTATEDDKISFQDSYSKDTQSAKFYCSTYDIPPPSLTSKRDPLTKKTYITKYTSPELISITWQENQSLEVWAYHQNWMRYFYNRENDQYVRGTAGKKRNAQIVIQQYSGYGPENKQDVFNPELGELITINLQGLVPQNIPALHGDWNQDASNSVGLTIKYTVDYIAIIKSAVFSGAQ